MKRNCSPQPERVNMAIDIVTLVGLAIILWLNWVTWQRVEELEDIVAQMLLDLGKKGVLAVEVTKDD
jgi:hypothetical protein